MLMELKHYQGTPPRELPNSINRYYFVVIVVDIVVVVVVVVL